MRILTPKEQTEKKIEELLSQEKFIKNKISEMYFTIDSIERAFLGKRKLLELTKEVVIFEKIYENILDYRCVMIEKNNKLK